MAAAGEVSGSRRRQLRRIAQRLGVIALSFLVAGPAAADAQPGPGVELTVDGRAPIFLSAASIQGEPQESHSYQDLGPAGGQTVTRSGVALRQLLSAAGVSPDQVSLLAVARPRGGFGYLYQADLSQQSDFADGPALVSMDGNSTRFFRPQRMPGDQNAADDIATADGQPLAISLYTGRLLRLKAAHTPGHAQAGQLVRLSAVASCCALPGERLSYTWDLGDNGAPATGATVRHRFGAAGSYQASVALTGSKGSVALPVQTTVVVGKSVAGKGRGSGGTGARRAPNSGPSNRSHHHGRGHQGAGRGAGSATPAASRSPARTQPTAPSATTTPTQTSPPAQATTPQPSPPATSAPVQRRSSRKPLRSPVKPAQTRGAAGLLPVDGVLVAGPGTLLASVQSLPSAPAGAQQSARGGNPAGAGSALPVGIGLALAIFAAGALRERRGPRARPL